MKHTRYLLTTMILSVSILLSTTAQVDAAPYSFRVDRFESIGNEPGTFVDDFNDGVIGSDWEVDDPTAVETGGYVTFRNPGTTERMTLGNLNISAQMSYISTDSFTAVDGQGDLSGTSTWSPVIPDINQLYVMGLGIEGTNEDISIGMSNLSTSVADYFGAAAGLGVFFMRSGNVAAGDFDMQFYSITTADISSDIFLRISFDDDTNQFTGGYSLDGSAPGDDQFHAISTDSLGSGFGWSLGAESWEVSPVPIPGAIWLFASGIAGLVVQKNKVVTCFFQRSDSLYHRI